MVAGEASGDLLGAHLVEALTAALAVSTVHGYRRAQRCRRPDSKPGTRQRRSPSAGMWRFCASCPRILRIRKAICALRLLADPPDLFIGVDAPDFNLGLEEALRRRGIPTVHYVSPSLWAWRGERIHKMARAASKVLCLFPFEPPIYEKVGVPAAYVGHPLADMLPEAPDRATAREQFKVGAGQTVVALLPGSRQSELEAMAELFIQTAKLVHQQLRQVHFLVPLISRETRRIFEDTLYRCEGQDLPLTILFGHAHLAMMASDGVLVASGTATLEAALLKRPMVVTYKMPRLSYLIGRAESRAALCLAAEYPGRTLRRAGDISGRGYAGGAGSGTRQPTWRQASAYAAGARVPRDASSIAPEHQGTGGRSDPSVARTQLRRLRATPLREPAGAVGT